MLLVPKLISCFYMHNLLSEEIRDGMKIMKFTINHPECFERRALDYDTSDKTDKDDGKYTRIIYAFCIGFIQWGIAVVLEIMSIFFLNSLDNYRLIIVCYAALTAVAHFDNMFAAALDSHPIKAAAGKKLNVTYSRYMHQGAEAEEDDGTIRHTNKQSLKKRPFPRSNIFLKFLRFVFKCIRIVHVCFFFYFAPFLMLFYQFYYFEVNQETDAA